MSEVLKSSFILVLLLEISYLEGLVLKEHSSIV